MRLLKITLLFLVLSTTATYGQLLWKITGKGLKTPSYLFATYHYIPIQFIDSVPGVYRAFESTQVLVCEIAFSRFDAIGRLQNAASMPNHTRMSALLKGEQYNLVDTELKNTMKLGLKDMNMMNPSLILSMYKMELFKKLSRQTDDTQSDSYFQLIANEKDKKVIGLENIEKQVEVLYGNGTLERQAEILYQNVLHKNELLQKMHNLDLYYKAGKLRELLEYSRGVGQVFDPTPDEFDKAVTQRNLEWCKQLPEIMNKNSCFIAVSAEHLSGKEGIIALLEKEGYHISALK